MRRSPEAVIPGMGGGVDVWWWGDELKESWEPLKWMGEKTAKRQGYEGTLKIKGWQKERKENHKLWLKWKEPNEKEQKILI